MSPIANDYLTKAAIVQKFYPLHAYVCDQCFLVQLEEFESQTTSLVMVTAYFSSQIVGYNMPKLTLI